MGDVNGVPVHIRIKEAYHNGLAWTALTDAIINSLGVIGSAIRSELHWTTNHHLWMFDGSNNRRIHGLDMVLTADGEIVVDDGEVVWADVL